MQILSRAHSSVERPSANYLLIVLDDVVADRLLKLYRMAERAAKLRTDFRCMEFYDYHCDAIEDLPDIMAEYEDMLADQGFVALPELDADQQQALVGRHKRRDFSLVQVESHLDIPSLCGFRWEFGVKPSGHSVESAQIPLDLVRKIAKPIAVAPESK